MTLISKSTGRLPENFSESPRQDENIVWQTHQLIRGILVHPQR